MPQLICLFCRRRFYTAASWPTLKGSRRCDCGGMLCPESAAGDFDPQPPPTAAAA